MPLSRLDGDVGAAIRNRLPSASETAPKTKAQHADTASGRPHQLCQICADFLQTQATRGQATHSHKTPRRTFSCFRQIAIGWRTRNPSAARGHTRLIRPPIHHRKDESRTNDEWNTNGKPRGKARTWFDVLRHSQVVHHQHLLRW